MINIVCLSVRCRQVWSGIGPPWRARGCCRAGGVHAPRAIPRQ